MLADWPCLMCLSAVDSMGLHWNKEPSLGLPCMVQLGQLRPGLACMGSLIKKKIKFSSYIRKLRMEQLQSHIWLTASSYMGKYLRISSYIRKPFLIYNCATAPLWISLYIGKFLFYQCTRLAQILFCFRFRRKMGIQVLRHYIRCLYRWEYISRKFWIYLGVFSLWFSWFFLFTFLCWI